MNAQLVALTQPFGPLAEVCKTPEDVLTYVARVSNPSNQANVSTGAGLLRYCLRNGHVSIFETVVATFEVQTSRAIAAQLLRHRSFTFQEFSQRYATVTAGREPVELRLKGGTNRQGSTEALPPAAEAYAVLNGALNTAQVAYDELLRAGVAPESARMVLPLATSTTLYVTGNVRSWIHYFEQRCSAHAQKEHRELALLVRGILAGHFPVLAEALNWRAADELPASASSTVTP